MKGIRGMTGRAFMMNEARCFEAQRQMMKLAYSAGTCGHIAMGGVKPAGIDRGVMLPNKKRNEKYLLGNKKGIDVLP